jgi:phenylpyruvate tautomerase PptA (4-oxalocrotonate tautomerase family)
MEINMPIIACENRSGLSLDIKSRLAKEITAAVQDAIKSPLDLISVIFHDLPAESTYRSGVPTSETLIICHIREGRTDGAIQGLLAGVSTAWSRITGVSEDEIELAVQQYPAKFTMRGGVRLPEPPHA